MSTDNTNPTNHHALPAVSITTARTGVSSKANALGMRPMQERAYAKRGEQYLLIKSPPASGKSRALMFIALDKLQNQDLKQALIVVPERSIGSSFADEKLTQYGFWADWIVEPQWNLCNAVGADDTKVAKSKVKAVKEFLDGASKVLVCTHATFRFAVQELGITAFDDRLIAVDEFHHVSSDKENNILGSQLAELIERDKAHLVAMTGSYFRGDAEAVLSPTDEAKFETVTYTYYEQLNGYDYLKSLDIGYFFYTGRYVDHIMKVLDPARKTIIHIPNVNSRESLSDKYKEVEEILDQIGAIQDPDPVTGFYRVKTKDGRILKIADLVDDKGQRSMVLGALKDPSHKNHRDHVDIIIALGMAKEGFDWIWCEHALTIGYRNSLTEIVQIIGRATRDAPGKTKATFTNLIAEPDATEAAVTSAINDTLKAIAASLLMEQVLQPRFEFTPKNAGAKDGYTYNDGQGYQQDQLNIGVNTETGAVHVEIKGLKEPTSPEAARICREDINEVIAAVVQDNNTLSRGLFDHENTLPEEINILQVGKIVRDRYPHLLEEDQEAIRQYAVAALALGQQAKQIDPASLDGKDAESKASLNTALIDGIRQLAMNVRELDIDLIDRINPFDAAYAILSKAMDEKTLKQVQAAIAAKKLTIPIEEARMLAKRALEFKNERGRLPDINAADPWEQRLAQGVAALTRYNKEEKRKEANSGK